MSEQIDIDGVKFKIGYDSKAVADGLKGDEKKAEESGKKAGQSWGNAFGAVAGALAGAKIVSTFKAAFDAANKLEKTMLGLEATAKLTGNSFEQLKKQVLDLSKDGVMGLDQAATSMKTLAAQGFSADKAFQLLEASKKVSAFNNIVGDAGQGVQDFIKFLQTGSAELAENMDPSIIKVVKSLGGYAKVSSDATAKQKLINAVIEKGNKLTGDYQKFLESSGQSVVGFNSAVTSLSQTLGQKLQPAMSALYNIGTKVLTFLTEIISKIDSTTLAVVGFGTASFLAISTFAKGAALLPGIFGSIGASVTAALGPIGLIIAALGGAIILGAKLKREFGQSETRGLLNERDALIQQVGSLQNVNAKTKELTDSKARLADINKKLIADYGPLLKYLDAENLSLEKKIALIDKLEKASRGLTAEKDLAERPLEEIRERRDARLSALREGSGLRARGEITAEEFADRGALLASEVSILNQEIERRTAAAKGSSSVAAANGGKASPEFRFIAARDELIKLEKEYNAYLKRTKDAGLRAQAEEKLNIERQAVTKQLRGSIAEYIEDRYTAEKLAIDAQRDQQIANVRELVNAKAISEEEAEEAIQEIREANARKTAQIQAESFARTMQAAQASTQGFAQMLNARDVGSALSGQGSFLSGLSQFSPALKALGPVGQGIGAAGAIVSTLTSLFGKSDEERAREAEQQKRRDEEARAILELQANYQKNMLALQEAAAKLPFDNLQREMRLADIQGQQRKLAGEDAAAVDASIRAQKLSLAQSTLTAEAGRISEDALFGGTGSTPNDLIRFLSERAAQSTAIGQFMALTSQAAGDVSAATLRELYSKALTYSGKIPPEIYEAGIIGLRQFVDHMNLPTSQRTNAQYEELFANLQSTPYRVGSLVSEVTRDTATAENLLSVIEQSNTLQLEISANTKKTAENTAKALELRPDRERSFIDVGQGYIQSLGQRITGMSVARRLGEQNFQLPSGIGSASGVATAARTVQELTADLLSMNAQQNDTMIDILQDVRAGIIELVAVLDGNPNTVSGLSVSEFTRIQSEINRRRR